MTIVVFGMAYCSREKPDDMAATCLSGDAGRIMCIDRGYQVPPEARYRAHCAIDPVGCNR